MLHTNLDMWLEVAHQLEPSISVETAQEVAELIHVSENFIYTMPPVVDPFRSINI